MTNQFQGLQKAKLKRVVSRLEFLGYDVNVHALQILRQYFKLDEPPKIVRSLKTSNAILWKEEIGFAPLSGAPLELWFPRYFQGKRHGLVANSFFACFGTKACLIGNPHVRRSKWPWKRRFPIFVDGEAKIRCGFCSFGCHYVYETLFDYLSHPDIFKFVSVSRPDGPDGTGDCQSEEFEQIYKLHRTSIIEFYNVVLPSLSAPPNLEVDLGEDIQ